MTRISLNRIFVALRHMRLGLPDTLGIEISLACNRRCSYCAASILNSKQRIIADEVFDKFIRRMKEMRWHGLVGIATFSEPSLVPESWRYVQAIRDAGALPTIFTNGHSPKAIGEWINHGAARIVITEHEPFDPQQAAEIYRLQNNCPIRITIKHLTPETITSLSFPRRRNGRIISKCEMVDAMGFDIDGQCYLCCSDYRRKHIMGNLDAPILETWNGYAHIRKRLKLGIPQFNMCRECMGKTKDRSGSAMSETTKLENL